MIKHVSEISLAGFRCLVVVHEVGYKMPFYLKAYRTGQYFLTDDIHKAKKYTYKTARYHERELIKRFGMNTDSLTQKI